jgi:hypothetical protein
MARRAGGDRVIDRVIEFPYLVMFRNENGHVVSVGGGSEFKTEKEATAKTKEKCDARASSATAAKAVTFRKSRRLIFAPEATGQGSAVRY